MSVSGHVKSWSLAKGFGFVKDEEGTEAFVHTSDIEGGTLIPDKPVTYDTKQSSRKTPSKREGAKLIAYNITGEGFVPRPTTTGQQQGTVKSWKFSKSIGFISNESGEDVYVHSSSFGGGSLREGKTVFYDVEDVGHKSGRKVAVNVSGEGVRPQGKLTGKVKKWILDKGYGFVELDDGGEAFIHRSEIGDGYCEVGKTLLFDLDSAETSRKVAINVSGPAVHDPDSYGKGGGGGGYQSNRGSYAQHGGYHSGYGKGQSYNNRQGPRQQGYKGYGSYPSGYNHAYDRGYPQRGYSSGGGGGGYNRSGGYTTGYGSSSYSAGYGGSSYRSSGKGEKGSKGGGYRRQQWS